MTNEINNDIPSVKNKITSDLLLQAYRSMKTIRVFEDRLHHDYAQGVIPGFAHLYAGQEATAVGIMSHLSDSDQIASTHRGHGHCIAKGVDVIAMMKEIYGKADGVCKGKGGSMHIADLSKGMMGANGILGAGAPLVCGAALAAKLRAQGDVAVCFGGDGGVNQGAVLESMNLATVWNLPLMFVVENNDYAQSTPQKRSTSVTSYEDRAKGFGMPSVTVDGLDFFSVYHTAGELIERMRKGGGPVLLECKNVRFYGHFEGDQQAYRPVGEVEHARREKDCLTLFIEKAQQQGVSLTALAEIDRQVTALIDEAVSAAKAAPEPEADALYHDVYVNY
ncbi:thiamine pyrophosphate-dependent dehydrogenase E1 component subunit alpha [Rosenbergiella epipactidis]|uniref:thiamine pyrophosphate-dependent dehydrogenase E1 component subunit alpha n=1 Tax=Rosenbergiella epipactidis TaxID=1544694 RepID=UPI00240E7743|nr:thiamine pyrophosphate-dependent dehydrogenase E1 component subunit alpha [Rosenbergiella epipactidis]